MKLLNQIKHILKKNKYNLYLIQIKFSSVAKNFSGIELFKVSAFTKEDAEKISLEYFKKNRSYTKAETVEVIHNELKKTPEFLTLNGPGLIDMW